LQLAFQQYFTFLFNIVEITTNDGANSSSTTPLWFSIVAAALVIAVYFFGLSVPLMGPDESRYAEVAREMYERGDWLTPTLAGHPWFEKPPLLYWLEIAGYQVFGVNEFAARFGPALCGIGIVVAMWALARTEGELSRGRLTLMTASTLGLIAFSHTAGFDVVLTLTMTCALVCFWKVERSSTAGKLPLIFFYLFTGFAILAKGLVGLFPFASIALYYVASRLMPRRRVLLSLLWGLPLMLLVAAPWHVVMYVWHGSEFIRVYFIQHHFERFTTNRYLHPQPFYFFWWVLPLMALPWAPFVIVRLMSVLNKRKGDRPAASPLFRFALCWVLVPLIFFSFSGSKLPGYILPALPPMLIIAWASLRDRPSKKWTTGVASVAVLSLVISLAATIAYLPAYAGRDTVKQLIAVADSRGYSNARVVTLFMVSYNAEFYARDRLVRDSDGNQMMLQGAQLVLDEINKDGRPVLVLVPAEYVSQLTEYPKVSAEVLANNGRVAIVAVAAKQITSQPPPA
jgi:4-amino-4-deoxy-L-arabinose transferase-like glycosyltransferase